MFSFFLQRIFITKLKFRQVFLSLSNFLLYNSHNFLHPWIKTFIKKKVFCCCIKEMKNCSELASTWHVVVFEREKIGRKKKMMKISCHVERNLFKVIWSDGNFQSDHRIARDSEIDVSWIKFFSSNMLDWDKMSLNVD